MTKKLTSTEINNRLSSKGIKIIGEYISSNISTMVECANGHQWTTRVANLLNRPDGCPYCSGHNNTKKWTTESINQHLASRSITLISEYTGKVAHKGRFKCMNNHEWETSITSVLNGKGCGQCYSKNLPLSLKDIQKRYHEIGYTVNGECSSSSSVLNFTCSNGHSWNAVARHTRCAACAEYGFKFNKPASGYILVFKTFIKYGISNSLESRLYRHRLKNPPHSVAMIKSFTDGKEAIQWENEIKEIFGGKFVDKSQCPDGFTETLSIECLESLIEKFGDSWHHKS